MFDFLIITFALFLTLLVPSATIWSPAFSPDKTSTLPKFLNPIFISFLLIGIARYCFTFYYNHRCSGSSTGRISKNISIKTGGGRSGGSSGGSSSKSSTLETISNTVSTIVEKIAPAPAPAPITETVTKVVSKSINPNLPDF